MSSSSDEAGSNPAPPPPAAAAPVAKARASSSAESSDEELAAVQPWLDKVMEAFINIPSEDAKKGISMFKVRNYLQDKHHVTKAKVQKETNPALKVALARKYIIKTTALNNVFMGSARLNPAYAISRLRHSEETEDEKVGGAGGRKRKASADEDGTKSVKRRFPFGKAH